MVNQVHGNSITILDSQTSQQISTTGQTADGLVTELELSALCIKTADCLPVMLLRDEKIMAVHAGWRGIENEIILKAREHFQNFSDVTAIIGPHIHREHFEVHKDIATQLLECAKKSSSRTETAVEKLILYLHKDPKKLFVDLTQIAQLQLLSLGLSPEQISVVGESTKGDSTLASYRRDGAQSGRNLSFCALLK